MCAVNCTYLTPVWTQKQYFSDQKGYTLYIVGSILISLGALLGVMYFLVLK